MTTNTGVTLYLSEREVATVVAALRNWQMDFEEQDLEDAFIGHFGRHRPLSNEEIDNIVRKCCLDESQGRWAV